MSARPAIDRVLLVPGLFSPRWLMSPLRRSLVSAGWAASTWDDASVFGPLDETCAQLASRLRREAGAARSLGVVTHSFGDWLARQVLARTDAPAVAALVSIVPVLTASPPARLAAALGAGVIPEVRTMADAGRASAARRLPQSIPRLVVWARLDVFTPRVDAAQLGDVCERVVTGTHNSLLLQPGVHRLVRAFLRNAGGRV